MGVLSTPTRDLQNGILCVSNCNLCVIINIRILFVLSQNPTREYQNSSTDKETTELQLTKKVTITYQLLKKQFPTHSVTIITVFTSILIVAFIPTSLGMFSAQ